MISCLVTMYKPATHAGFICHSAYYLLVHMCDNPQGLQNLSEDLQWDQGKYCDTIG